jgi:4-hydroxybenzoate polyprenyltransferase
MRYLAPKNFNREEAVDTLNPMAVVVEIFAIIVVYLYFKAFKGASLFTKCFVGVVVVTIVITIFSV